MKLTEFVSSEINVLVWGSNNQITSCLFLVRQPVTLDCSYTEVLLYKNN